MASDWLTTKEAATRLRLTEDTLRRYAKRGLVRRVALNSRTHRYDAASIEALLNDATPAGTGAAEKLGTGAADHERF